MEEYRPLSNSSQISECQTLVVAGGEKVLHPVFSRGQCKGVQSVRGPQLLTLDRWEAGGRAVASLLEDGVGVETGVLTMIIYLGFPHPPVKSAARP